MYMDKYISNEHTNVKYFFHVPALTYDDVAESQNQVTSTLLVRVTSYYFHYLPHTHTHWDL